jgi:hypothetical protein
MALPLIYQMFAKYLSRILVRARSDTSKEIGTVSDFDAGTPPKPQSGVNASCHRFLQSRALRVRQGARFAVRESWEPAVRGRPSLEGRPPESTPRRARKQNASA